MRVLSLVTDAYGGYGGIAQAARDVIGALAASPKIQRIDVLPRHAPKHPIALPAKISQTSPTPCRLRYSVRSIAIAQSRKPDLIFCNHLYMAPLAAFVARQTGAKLLIQLHGIEIWAAPTNLQRKALEAADLLLCVSRDTRARALSSCDLAPERMIVLNNTFDERFKPGSRTAARARFNLDGTFALLIVARMDSQHRYKGHDLLIGALRAICDPDGLKMTLLVAGDGDDRARIEELANSQGVASRVRFLGKVSDEDMPDLYRAADLFVLPSKGEGFGIVFLEAMASGTPVMGLGIGGAPDALGDGMLGAMAHSDDQFLDVLRGAIYQAQARTDRLAADVRDRFGPDIFRKQLDSVLQMLE